MHLKRLWSLVFPNPRFYGWAIVGLCFLCSVLSSPGQSFVLSLYLEHLIDDLGLSRLEVSSMYGAMTLLAAICLPFAGRLADRFEGRHFLGVVLLLLGVACLFFSQVTGLIGVAIAFFSLRLLGQGAIGLGTLTIVVRWFRQYRSRALAVVSLGYAAGEMVFPGLILTLIAAVGWQGSLLSFGAAYLFFFAPVVFLLVRTRRTDESFDGEASDDRDEPDESAPVDDAEPPAEARRAGDQQPTDSPHTEDPAFELSDVLARPDFWVMVVCVSVLPLVVTAVIFHQVALFESMGWAVELIATAFAGFAAARVVTTYAVGLILERISSRFGICAGMVVATATLFAILLPLPELVASMIYGCGLGMASGALSAANGIVWPEYYGIEALGAVKGVVTSIRNGATAAGPPLVALLAGPGEQFTTAIIVLATMSALTAIVSPFVPPPNDA